MLIILIGGIINSKNKNQNAKFIYCVTTGIILLIIMGFRHIDLGMTDTKLYMYQHLKI